MESSLRDVLVQGAAQFGISMGEPEVELFDRYLEFLLEYNKRTNLTAIRDRRGVIVKHFLDSIAVIPHLPLRDNLQVLDLGTGGGFPGVPIKILLPSVKVVLLDSVKKKVDFLNDLVGHLGLSEITALSSRAEELGRSADFRERFDVVVSRAVAELTVLAELCLPFVQIGGLFIAYKGLKAEAELNDAEAALKVLGGRVLKKVDVVVPDLDEKRILVFVQKEGLTPDAFPRRIGVPEKKPLRKGAF